MFDILSFYPYITRELLDEAMQWATEYYLGIYVWRKRDEGLDPVFSWKYLGKNVPNFNPISEICLLCTHEKFQIVLNPRVATLNQKTVLQAKKCLPYWRLPGLRLRPINFNSNQLVISIFMLTYLCYP